MPLVAPTAPPSTLADVIQQVKGAFDRMANMTPIMVGKAYLERNGAGSPPHVVFAPEPKGKIGPAIEMGNACSITHSCDVIVRAAETGDELTRFVNAYALGDLVIDCIQTAATGRVTWGEYSDDSPTDTDALGAELAFSFSYQRDVPHNPTRWGLAAADAGVDGGVPVPPPGIPATVGTFAVSTTPKAS